MTGLPARSGIRMDKNGQEQTTLMQPYKGYFIEGQCADGSSV
jgi:hypothetical protein